MDSSLFGFKYNEVGVDVRRCSSLFTSFFSNIAMDSALVNTLTQLLILDTRSSARGDLLAESDVIDFRIRVFSSKGFMIINNTMYFHMLAMIIRL